MQLAKVACNDLLLLRWTRGFVASSAENRSILLVSDLVRVPFFVAILAGLAELRQRSELVCIDKLAIAARSD